VGERHAPGGAWPAVAGHPDIILSASRRRVLSPSPGCPPGWVRTTRPKRSRRPASRVFAQAERQAPFRSFRKSLWFRRLRIPSNGLKIRVSAVQVRLCPRLTGSADRAGNPEDPLLGNRKRAFRWPDQAAATLGAIPATGVNSQTDDRVAASLIAQCAPDRLSNLIQKQARRSLLNHRLSAQVERKVARFPNTPLRHNSLQCKPLTSQELRCSKPSRCDSRGSRLPEPRPRAYWLPARTAGDATFAGLSRISTTDKIVGIQLSVVPCRPRTLLTDIAASCPSRCSNSRSSGNRNPSTSPSKNYVQVL
jgi:hypothetical protein